MFFFDFYFFPLSVQSEDHKYLSRYPFYAQNVCNIQYTLRTFQPISLLEIIIISQVTPVSLGMAGHDHQA